MRELQYALMTRSFIFKIIPRQAPVKPKSKVIPPLKVYEAIPTETPVLPKGYTHPIVTFPMLEKEKILPPVLFKARKRFCPYSVYKLNQVAACVLLLINCS